VRNILGSEVFLREDIRRNLQSILVTNDLLSRQMPTQAIATYREGFIAAIAAVATAFEVEIDPYAVPYRYLPGE
jgi:hypothetical protein